MKLIIYLFLTISISNVFAKGEKEAVECQHKCGEAPRLIDMPSPNERDYDFFISRLTTYNNCIDKCEPIENNGKKNVQYEESTPRINKICEDVKTDEQKYQKCMIKNFGMHAGMGIYGAMGNMPNMGMAGGMNMMPNIGMGFCTPNNTESECETADGRVFVHDKSRNQLERKIGNEKNIDKNRAESYGPKSKQK